MKKHVRGALLVFMTLVLVLPVTAGGGKEAESKDDVATEITFVILGGTQEDIMPQMIADFKEETGITVNYESWPYGEAYNKYVTQAMAGNLPDAGYVFAYMMPEFIERGVLVPVEDYISSELKEDFFDPLREYASMDGVMWAMPAWYSTNLISYRKDLLDDLGLSVPKTAEEVLEVSKALHNPPAMYGASFPGGQQATFAVRWMATQLWGRGGKFLSDDGKKAAFNSKAGVETLEYLKSLVPYYQAGYLAQGEHELARAYHSGLVPWIQMSMGFALLQPMEKNPEWEIQIAPPPTPQKAALGIMDSYFLFKSTPARQAAAMKWLEYTQKPEYTEHTNIAVGFLPTRKSAKEYYMNTDFFRNHKQKDQIEIYLDAANYSRFPPFSPIWAEIQEILLEAIQRTMTGDLSAQAALDRAEEKVNQALDNFYN
jgi:multiple sugar transport system substrate-binding protein